MTLQEFIAKWEGKPCEVTGSAYALNQCVDLANAYLRDVLNHPIIEWTNAVDFPSKLNDFEFILNTPTGVPQTGDLVIWGGAVGHIAIFIEGNSSSFTSFDQNFPTGSVCHKQLHNYTVPQVKGWLHPKGTMNPDEIAVKKTDFENLVKKSTALDEILAKYQVADSQALFNMVAGKDARITDLSNQLGTAQAEMKNREEQVSRLNTQLLTAQADNSELITRLNKTVENYETAMREKGQKEIEIQQLKVQLETAKQGEFRVSLADLFKMIWNQKIIITKG